MLEHETLKTDHAALQNNFDAVQAENTALTMEHQGLKTKYQIQNSALDESNQSEFFYWLVYIWTLYRQKLCIYLHSMYVKRTAQFAFLKYDTSPSSDLVGEGKDIFSSAHSVFQERHWSQMYR